jgi:hypothetical protein
MTQVHKQFTDDQLKSLFRAYEDGQIDRARLEEVLGSLIGKIRGPGLGDSPEPEADGQRHSNRAIIPFRPTAQPARPFLAKAAAWKPAGVSIGVQDFPPSSE